MKLPEPRRFNYRFRYFNPEGDDEKRIHFRRIRKSDSPKGGSSLRLVVLLVIIFLIVFFLSRQATVLFAPSSSKITIEEIEVVE